MNPIGHKNAQTARPRSVPVSKRNPVTKKGNFPLEIVFCNAPSGQEAIAPGQE